ncbi:MAG: hypothetical protein HY660_07295 [Armatimonadetes bacterium]|nr:hypothetical protein [Armatimonadota bacterium]
MNARPRRLWRWVNTHSISLIVVTAAAVLGLAGTHRGLIILAIVGGVVGMGVLLIRPRGGSLDGPRGTPGIRRVAPAVSAGGPWLLVFYSPY